MNKHVKIRRNSYFFVRRMGGKLVRKTLGKVGEITAADADRLAANLMADCLLDQIPEREPEQEPETGVTLRQLWERFYAVHARPRKKSHAHDVYLWEKYVAPFASVPAEAFDLVQQHARWAEEHGKVSANRLMSMVRKMYRVSNLEPPKVQKFREHSRERFLSHDEIGRLLEACETSSIGDFVRLCLFTGARSGNVRQMRWSDVDLENRVWTIGVEDMKNGDVMRVHLTEKAVAVLASRERFEGCDWVFPQRGGKIDAPMWRPGRQWDKLCAAAGLKDCTPHDLRRSVGSHMAMQGCSMPVIASVLGHRDLKSTAVYARVAQSAASAAVDAVVAGF